jgi:hypothetical protein
MEALRTFLLAEERPDRDPTLAMKGTFLFVLNIFFNNYKII